MWESAHACQGELLGTGEAEGSYLGPRRSSEHVMRDCAETRICRQAGVEVAGPAWWVGGLQRVLAGSQAGRSTGLTQPPVDIKSRRENKHDFTVVFFES